MPLKHYTLWIMHWVQIWDRTVSFFFFFLKNDYILILSDQFLKEKKTEGESLRQNSTNSSMFGYPLERCSIWRRMSLRGLVIVDGAVSGGLGDMALMEEVCRWRWVLRVKSLLPLPVSSLSFWLVYVHSWGCERLASCASSHAFCQATSSRWTHILLELKPR